MKKLICTLSLFTLISLSSFSIGFFDIKIQTEIGVLNGQVNEFVFANYCKNTDNKLSELNWDLKNIPYLSLSVSSDINRYVNISFTGLAGLPKSSGKMRDYDWLNSKPPTGSESWINDDPTELTNFSCHDNELTSFFETTLAVGGNIYLPKNFILTPFVAWNYKYIGFEGWDGYYKYKKYNFDTKYLDGKVISYKQEYNSLMIGINCETSISQFNFFAQVMISPFLGFNTSADYHLYGGNLFLDIIDNLFEIKAQIKSFYTFSKHHKAGVSLGIDYIPVSKGSEFSILIDKNGNIKQYSTWQHSNDGQGGTSLFIFTAALNYTFSF